MHAATPMDKYKVLGMQATICTSVVDVTTCPVSKPEDPTLTCDGCGPVAKGQLNQPGTWPPAVPTFAECVQALVFGDMTADPSARNGLSFCKMTHTTSGEIRFWSVAMFLQWLGYARTPFAKVTQCYRSAVSVFASYCDVLSL